METDNYIVKHKIYSETMRESEVTVKITLGCYKNESDKLR